MAVDWPDAPDDNDTFDVGATTYTYDASVGAWLINAHGVSAVDWPDAPDDADEFVVGARTYHYVAATNVWALPVAAPGGPITDDFTGTNGSAPAAPWVVDILGTETGGYARIENNRLEMNQNNLAYNGQVANWGTTDYADFDLTVEVIWPSSIVEAYPAVGFRLSGGTNGWAEPFGEGNDGYVVYLDPLAGSITMQKQTGGTQVDAWPVFGKSFTADTVHALRIRAVGSALKAKVWNTSGGEPGTWDIEQTDATYTTGRVGLRGQAQTANVKNRFDNWSFEEL